MNQRTFSFKGTHRETGEQVGLQYKKWGRNKIVTAPNADKYYKKQIEIYTNYFPEFLEYLGGVTKALSFEPSDYIKSVITGFIPNAWEKKTQKDKNCSTFALRNKNGVFVGRNYDWREASESCASFFEVTYTNDFSNSFKAVSDMNTWKYCGVSEPETFIFVVCDGWNEQGLYVAVNGAPGSITGNGMSICHALQLILEKCPTFEKAVSLAKEIPLSESKIITVADKSGNFAIVEKSYEKGSKVRALNNLIFTTNHYNHEDLKSENEQIFKEIPFHATFGRYAYLDVVLNNHFEELDLDKTLEIMSKPPVVQNWRGKENGDTVTVWTSALNLKTGKYKIRFSPQTKEYFEKIEN